MKEKYLDMIPTFAQYQLDKNAQEQGAKAPQFRSTIKESVAKTPELLNSV